MPYASYVPPSPSVLIVVDPQKQFVGPNTAHIYPVLQALLPKFDWVIASRLVPLPGGPVERFKRWQPLPESSDGAQIALDLGVRPAERTRVIRKTGFTAITPEVAAWLQETRTTEVHVCGGDTDMCVLGTAKDLFESGIRPILLTDACATMAGEPLHSHALIQFKRLFGKAQLVAGSE
jgi:nicotinamidase-related amidase